MRVAIIDYGLCNLGSVCRAVEVNGGSPFITAEPKEAVTADKFILPGVGAFPDAMSNLNASGMSEALREMVLGKSRLFLGVCLGMQLLADSSTEGGRTPGLGWVPGIVKKLEPAEETPKKRERVPHVGWNEVIPNAANRLFANIDKEADFYFVHSYHFDVLSEDHVLATTPYCNGFVSAVQKDNIFGTQFHPEKSQKNGLNLLANFLAL